MDVIRTILTLGTVVTAVLVPVFVGHALAVHQTRPVLYALVLAVIAVGLGVVITRRPARRS